MDTLSSTKEARIYNGEKTISLASSAGKTHQSFVKEMEQQTGSKEEKEFVKAVYSHPVYLTYMQSTS